MAARAYHVLADATFFASTSAEQKRSCDQPLVGSPQLKVHGSASASHPWRMGLCGAQGPRYNIQDAGWLVPWLDFGTACRICWPTGCRGWLLMPRLVVP